VSQVYEGLKSLRVLHDFFFSIDKVAVKRLEEISESIVILFEDLRQVREDFPLSLGNFLSLLNELLYKHDYVIFEVDLFGVLYKGEKWKEFLLNGICLSRKVITLSHNHRLNTVHALVDYIVVPFTFGMAFN
jgi:hypothetical protein